MSPEKDIREGFEEGFNIFVKLANTRVEYRIGSQKGFADTNKLSLTFYVSCRLLTSSSIEESTTKGSRQERSVVSSCKITMSIWSEWSGGWGLRLGFAATKLSKRLMNECPRIKIDQFRSHHDRWLKALKTHLHRVSLDLKQIFTNTGGKVKQIWKLNNTQSRKQVICSL